MWLTCQLSRLKQQYATENARNEQRSPHYDSSTVQCTFNYLNVLTTAYIRPISLLKYANGDK